MFCDTTFTMNHGVPKRFFTHQLCGTCRYISDLQLSKLGVDLLAHYVNDSVTSRGERS